MPMHSSQIAHNSLQEIFINNFRNISEMNLVFNDGINLFIGDNGQGKTNCLEAIALACSLRPMQSLNNSDLIKIDHQQALIKAAFKNFTIGLDIRSQGKKATLNGKGIRSAEKIHEKIPIVSFIPLELSMISGATSLRRRALDLAASSLYCEHASRLKAYEKILCHRNRLLKSWPIDFSMLNTFSDLLTEEGAKIIYQRLKTISELAPHFSLYAKNILGTEHNAFLSYQIDERVIENHTEADLKMLLREKKQRLASQEQARKVTLFGPHLDDMIFYLNKTVARSHASRGQMRALVLSFKLAQLLSVFRVREHAPIVILDDIVSELDEEKKSNLISVIKTLGTQAFFSATDQSAFGQALDPHIYVIRHGSLVAH